MSMSMSIYCTKSTDRCQTGVSVEVNTFCGGGAKV